MAKKKTGNKKKQAAGGSKKNGTKKKTWAIGIAIILLAVLVTVIQVLVTGSSRDGAVAQNDEPAGNVEEPAADEMKNVLLVTIDTLRADHLGCYMSRQAKTPEIDRFSKDAVRYFDCSSVAFGTTPSHVSIMTSTYARQHGVYNNKTIMSPHSVTIAEILKDAGYHTAAFVSAIPVRSSLGLDQGFEFFDQDFDPEFNYIERRAEQVTDRAIEWMRNYAGRKPFFVWVHYFDPHKEYVPPGKFKNLHLPVNKMLKGDYGSAEQRVDKAEQAIIYKALYAGEISYTDKHLGRLLDWMRTEGHYDNTMTIVTADHGETLDEPGRGLRFAHPTVYEEVVHIPLIIRTPGQEDQGGKIVRKAVCTLDILPTVMDFLDIPIPGVIPVQGRSLIGESFKENNSPRPIFFEIAHRRGAGVKVYPLKYVKIDDQKSYFTAIKAANPAPEQLFHLGHDPGEWENLYMSGHPDMEKMRELREIWKQNVLKGIPSIPPSSLNDPDHLKKLKQLGYM